jgi:hypothetical protein
MSAVQIALNLKEIPLKVERQQYIDALRIIRETKLLAIDNIYISGLEHFVSQLPNDFSQSTMIIISALIQKANEDAAQKIPQHAEEFTERNFDRTFAVEKLKTKLFLRADEYLEVKAYGRALEEIRRILIIDPTNIVAKQYEEKILQLTDLKREEQE